MAATLLALLLLKVESDTVPLTDHHTSALPLEAVLLIKIECVKIILLALILTPPPLYLAVLPINVQLVKIPLFALLLQ